MNDAHTSVPLIASRPAIRLAASRAALTRQMKARHEPTRAQAAGQLHDPDGALDAGSRTGNLSAFKLAKQAVVSWWRYHPAHIAVDAGRPYLAAYARDKPLQMLGIATGVGVLLVVVKPWRLISMTGLIVTAIRSTNLPASLVSLLANLKREQTDDLSTNPEKNTP